MASPTGGSDLEATVVVEKTRRETVLNHVWDRCNQAWAEGDFRRSLNLDRLWQTIYGMTDEEYECSFECETHDCGCKS